MQRSSPCPVCRLGELSRTAFAGAIRAGGFGALTSASHTVLECCNCGIQQLQGKPLDYESDDYRTAYDGDADAAAFFSLHDAEQSARLTRIGVPALRGRVVADYGCGAGAFLDVASGVATETLGIEPSRRFRAALHARRHRALSSAEEVPDASVDVAVSFQVLEHVADAVGFLREIARGLRGGGALYLTTPNRADMLAALRPPGYEPFFYRTAHVWYFHPNSLILAAQKAGFDTVQVLTEQKYDLSNAMCWLRDGRPTGNGKLCCLGGQIDAAWKAFVEERMLGDTLWLIARRSTS